MVTRVKICGLTRPEDAALAAELGADAIGLNFVGGPRKIAERVAAAICEVLPPLVRPVLLVRGVDLVEAAYETVPWKLALANVLYQVYDVPAISVGEFPEPLYWPVFHVGQRADLQRLACDVADGRKKLNLTAVVLDTAAKSGQLGGTGETFNWQWIAEARAAGELDGLPPIVLAGGLTPDNVGDAIRIAQPYAVDVSSGVEVAGKPGVKDRVKMRDFIQAAKGV